MSVPLGQDIPHRAAVQALRSGRLAHAQLLTGPAGSGKGLLAETIACAVLCEASAEVGGCGECPACHRVLAGAHPDLHWLAAGAHLGIDEVREVTRLAALAPHSGPCSVFVLEGAERLTGPAAGALLKTLEDPPGRSMFLLLCEHADQMEPTLRSRCLNLRLRPVPAPAVAAWLGRTRPDLPDARRQAAAVACLGRPGLALTLAAQDPDAPTEAQQVAEALGAATPGAAARAAGSLAAAGAGPECALALLRDAWLGRHGLLDEVGAAGGLAPEQLSAVPVPGAPRALALAGVACLAAQEAIDANVNPSLNWTVLLQRLRRIATTC